jgi:Flp pilus assembly protein TadG
MARPQTQRGSALLEFTLSGIPMMFIWISVVQMGIGMWQYHTIQYAVKTAGAYATVHGSDCSTGGNSCTIEVENVAQVLQNYLIGVDPTQVTVTFNAMASDHVTVASTITCTLSGGVSPCLSNTTQWPPSGNNAPGTDIEIQTEYLWKSALAMVAPGPGAGPVSFGTFWLPGFTHQTIVF